MGWFSRKKKVEVPLPPSDDLLKFPKPAQIEKEIKPEKIQQAVGLDKPPELAPLEVPEPKPFPQFPKEPEMDEEPEEDQEELPHKKLRPLPPQPTFQPAPRIKPFFLRIQDYQTLIDDLSQIKDSTNDLDELNENMERSEYNENRNYSALKAELEKIHDHLLFIDDRIFKE